MAVNWARMLAWYSYLTRKYPVVIFLGSTRVTRMHKYGVVIFHILKYVFWDCLHSWVVVRNYQLSNKPLLVKFIFCKKLTTVYFHSLSVTFVVQRAIMYFRLNVELCWVITPFELIGWYNSRHNFNSVDSYHKVTTINWIIQVPWVPSLSPYIGIKFSP